MRNKDSALLYFVAEFRLVTERQLKELTGRQTLWRRLPALVEQKKLYRKRRGVYEPYVYAIYNISGRKDFEHDLIITDIHIALHKSGRLLEWVQPKQKFKGEINEDAFCILSAGNKQLHCFIEADNSSEPDWQIQEKVERYLSYYHKTQKLFRVLFVAPTPKRSSELVRAAQRAIPKEAARMFLFASLPEFKQDCFGPVCSICQEDRVVSLAPVMVK